MGIVDQLCTGNRNNSVNAESPVTSVDMNTNSINSIKCPAVRYSNKNENNSLTIIPMFNNSDDLIETICDTFTMAVKMVFDHYINIHLKTNAARRKAFALGIEEKAMFVRNMMSERLPRIVNDGLLNSIFNHDYRNPNKYFHHKQIDRILIEEELLKTYAAFSNVAGLGENCPIASLLMFFREEYISKPNPHNGWNGYSLFTLSHYNTRPELREIITRENVPEYFRTSIPNVIIAHALCLDAAGAYNALLKFIYSTYGYYDKFCYRVVIDTSAGKVPRTTTQLTQDKLEVTQFHYVTTRFGNNASNGSGELWYETARIKSYLAEAWELFVPLAYNDRTKAICTNFKQLQNLLDNLERRLMSLNVVIIEAGMSFEELVYNDMPKDSAENA